MLDKSKAESYMQRCIHLAQKGKNGVKSNPHVGAVIVYNNKIIGEGYHMNYGSHHAEVQALNSVKKKDHSLLSQSTMYVSLEPCNHHGKTPPCVEAIIKSRLKNVVIGSKDPSPEMMGQSIEILRKNGINVMDDILSDQTDQLIRPFNANRKSIPYIIIKFAQSSDFYIAKSKERTQISNEQTSIFTHRLRSENEGILIGTNTAKIDNPSLSTRDYPGSNPLRFVLDRNETISKEIKLLTDELRTIVLTMTSSYNLNKENKEIICFNEWKLENILKAIYEKGVHSLLVEGGAKVIRWFVKEKFWHEAFIITSESLTINDGIRAPRIKGKLNKKYSFGSDSVAHIVNI